MRCAQILENDFFAANDVVLQSDMMLQMTGSCSGFNGDLLQIVSGFL